MNLRNILEGIPHEIKGNAELEIDELFLNSKNCLKGGLFCAVKGSVRDGHDHIEEAIDSGAKAILCEKIPYIKKKTDGITFITVSDSSSATGIAAHNFFGKPTEKLKLVGVTGTNGKTTVATLLYQIFSKLGYKSGLISTAGNMILDKELPAERTTPDPITLNSLLKDMCDSGVEYAFMEVSSHAVVQKRISGLSFKGGIFTNLTQDHLDYHKTMEEYAKAKQGFFNILKEESFALSNDDDARGNLMLENTKASKFLYSLKNPGADFFGQVANAGLAGMEIDITHKTKENHRIMTNLIGHFNAYNVLAAWGTAYLLGIDTISLQKNMTKILPPKGRFSHFSGKNNTTAIVDYAHTPDALLNILKVIDEIRTPEQEIITVVGCGGDRDRTKRPIMAKIAYEMSDKIILTSDNPRSEDPSEILAEMKNGIPDDTKKVKVIEDRREAIGEAVKMAKPNSIILVAGKGHENYQEIKGVKTHFDDMEELQKFLS